MERREVIGVTGPNWSAYSHELRSGRRTRLLLSYLRAYRRMLWVDVRPDGSVVVGPGMRATTMDRRVRRRASDRPLPTTVVSGIGESQVPPGMHLTFHGSGVINVHGVRAYRAPLSGSATQQLCAVDFAHPALLQPVEAEPLDVALPYVLHNGASVRGRLTIVPEPLAAFFDDAPVQTAILLPFLRPDKSVLLYLQVSLLERDTPWPDCTTFEYVSQDAAVHGFQGQL